MNELLAATDGSVLSHRLHIGGHWHQLDVDSVIDVRSPAHGGHLATVPRAGPSAVDTAVQVAHKTFSTWSALDPFDRAQHLRAFADVIRQHMEELVDLETAITGRPIREMRAQLARVPEWLEYFSSIALGLEAESNNVKGGFVTLTRYEPLGVCAMLTPWNHPILILIKKLSAALAAGNSCVVKPSSQAPVTPLLLGYRGRTSGRRCQCRHGRASGRNGALRPPFGLPHRLDRRDRNGAPCRLARGRASGSL